MRALREAPPDAPSWPRKAALSPSSLRQYTNCPHRLRLQYIERRKAPFAFNLHLNQGNIAHNLLAEAAHRRKHGQPQRSEDELFARAFHRLPKGEFPSLNAHEAAAAEVIDWVDYGRRALDRDADILAVEKPGRREVPLPRHGIRLEVATRPDLILLRTDPDGERFVEIVDYKTGSKEWVDEIPPVTMRFVFKRLLQDISPDTRALQVRFTYVWLAHRETREIDLTPDYCDAAWASVTDVIDQVMAEQDWPVRPSSLCHYCPYNGNACHAFAELSRPGEDDW